MWRDLTKTLRDLRRTLGDSHGSYRPDLHYMRGPGPKWHAKYGALVTKAPQNAASARPSLQPAEHRA